VFVFLFHRKRASYLGEGARKHLTHLVGYSCTSKLNPGNEI
jgi:hypothetical protein